MIKIIKISKEVDKKKILDNISLELPDTGFVALSGEELSWSGFILGILGGMEAPTNGSVIIDNTVLTHKNEKELAEFRDKNLALLAGENDLVSWMSVRENLEFVNDASEFDSVVKSFNIENIMDKQVSEITLEEKYRVALARIILKNPRIILVDEIPNNLSRGAKTATLKLLKSLSRQRLVVLVSRDDYEVDEYIDVLVEFESNKIVKVNRFKDSFAKNEIVVNRSKFPIFKFVRRYFELFKYRILLSIFFGILSIFSFLLGSALKSIDLASEHAGHLLSNDSIPVLLETGNDILGENVLKMIEETKFIDSPLKIGKTVGGINNAYAKFSFGTYDEKKNGLYYKDPVEMYSYFDVEALDNIDFGASPSDNSEIVINSYLADLMIELGVEDSEGELYRPKDYEELVNSKRYIKLGDKNVAISGIKVVDLKHFSSLKETRNTFKNIEVFEETVKNVGANIYVIKGFFELFSVVDECNPIYNFKYAEADDTIPVERRVVFKNSIVLEDETLVRELNKGEIIIGKDDVKHLGIYADTAIGNKISLFVEDSSMEETYVLDFIVKGISRDGNMYFNREDLSDYFWDGVGVNKVEVHERDENNLRVMLERGLFDENIFIKTPYSGIFNRLGEQLRSPETLLKLSCISGIFLTISCFGWLVHGVLKEFNRDLRLLSWIGIPDWKLTSSISVLVAVESVIVTSLGLVFSYISKVLINHMVGSLVFNSVDMVAFNTFEILSCLAFLIVVNVCIYFIVVHSRNRARG